MPHTSKAVFVSAVLLFIISACSTSEQTATETQAPPSDIPSWFVSSGFSSDSLSFHGFAQAISSDSAIAAANARLQAKANLESALAAELEDVRDAMEQDGNNLATNSDFIITLRNAHQSIQEEAVVANAEAVNKGDYFRGFSQVSISKNEFRGLLESGFTGSTSNWTEFSNSPAFQALIDDQ